MKVAEIRNLEINEINRRARFDADSLIEEETLRYDREIEKLARFLAENFDSHCLIMLSGPSSSGKTTTSLKITNYLRDLGIDAHTISMDDFYRGRGRLLCLKTVLMIMKLWKPSGLTSWSNACRS